MNKEEIKVDNEEILNSEHVLVQVQETVRESDIQDEEDIIERQINSKNAFSRIFSFQPPIIKIDRDARILVVDDEPFNLMACKCILKAVGMTNVDTIV